MFIHKHFTSVPEYAEWARSELGDVPSQHDYVGDRLHGRAWDGIGLLENGDESYVDEARALLSQIQENVEVPIYSWQHDMAGAYPDVPAMLAGLPETMYNRHVVTSDRSPIRVWFGVSATWSITEQQLRTRATALAAFAIALSEKRPVYLTPFVNRDEYTKDIGSAVSWDIATSPLVLGQLLASMRPEVTRYLGIPLTWAANKECQLAFCPFSAITPEMLHIGPSDLYLPPIHADDPLLNDPLEWVKEHLAKYGEEQEV